MKSLRDENTTFENRPMHWQRSEAGQAEQARLLRLDNLIQELHDAREEVGAMQPDEQAPLSHRAINNSQPSARRFIS
jgi:hypothetical protein